MASCTKKLEKLKKGDLIDLLVANGYNDNGGDESDVEDEQVQGTQPTSGQLGDEKFLAMLRPLLNECTKGLQDEIQALRLQLAELQANITAAGLPPGARPKNAGSHRDTKKEECTLVIGDSLIRDLDQDKMVQTEVVSLSGGRISTVIDELKQKQRDSKKYKRVICSIGTNDCGNDSFACNDFAAQAEQLVAMAKENVAEPTAVSLSSIPPRQDNTTHQENVDLANACLVSVAEKEGITFINNDPSFKLSDGMVNDGYLAPDGLHLSRPGSRRLATNMKLQAREGVDNDVTTARWQRQRSSKQENDGWQTQRHSRKARMARSQRDEGQQQHACKNCGELNHSLKNCRYDQELECYTCGRLGHKSRTCSRRQSTYDRGSSSQPSQY